MIKDEIATFDVINEIVLLKKNQLDETILEGDVARLADLEEYANAHMINQNLFGVYDRVWNDGSLLPYFNEIDVENMICFVNQLCHQYFNKALIYQETKQTAIAIIVETAETHGISFHVEESIVALCSNQLVSEAIRLSDYYTLREV